MVRQRSVLRRPLYLSCITSVTMRWHRRTDSDSKRQGSSLVAARCVCNVLGTSLLSCRASHIAPASDALRVPALAVPGPESETRHKLPCRSDQREGLLYSGSMPIVCSSIRHLLRAPLISQLPVRKRRRTIPLVESRTGRLPCNCSPGSTSQ